MATVEVTGKVNIGNRTYNVLRVEDFFGTMGESFIEATLVQLRILAYYSRDLIIDKLLAQVPPEGELKIFRTPTRPSRADEEELREPPLERLVELDPKLRNAVRRPRVFLPKRSTRPFIRKPLPFKHTPLTVEYLKKKVREGKDPRILLSTGDYVQGIQVKKRRVPPRQDRVVYVVGMANRPHRYSGIPLPKLARLHEYGASRYQVPLFGDPDKKVDITIPARPHWRPVMRTIRRVLQDVGLSVRARSLETAVRKVEGND